MVFGIPGNSAFRKKNFPSEDFFTSSESLESHQAGPTDIHFQVSEMQGWNKPKRQKPFWTKKALPVIVPLFVPKAEGVDFPWEETLCLFLAGNWKLLPDSVLKGKVCDP